MSIEQSADRARPEERSVPVENEQVAVKSFQPFRDLANRGAGAVRFFLNDILVCGSKMSADFILPIADDDVDVGRVRNLECIIDDALENALLAEFLEDERMSVGGDGVFSGGENNDLEFGFADGFRHRATLSCEAAGLRR